GGEAKFGIGVAVADVVKGRGYTRIPRSQRATAGTIPTSAQKPSDGPRKSEGPAVQGSPANPGTGNANSGTKADRRQAEEESCWARWLNSRRAAGKASRTAGRA